MLEQLFRGRAAGKRRLPRQALVERGAQRINVGAMIDVNGELAGAELLLRLDGLTGEQTMVATSRAAG